MTAGGKGALLHFGLLKDYPMLISEAKNLIGHIVDITFTDRSGKEYVKTAEVFDVGFVPLYGPCMITDVGEVRLDRVFGVSISDEGKRRFA